MNYRQAQIFLITTIIIAILLISALVIRPFFYPDTNPAVDVPVLNAPEAKRAAPSPKPKQPIKELHIDRRVGNLGKQFADLNPDHLVYAERFGIKPIASPRDILNMKRPIVHIESGDNYVLDKLTHSYPYLVPEAAALLDTIGVRFNRKLAERGGAHYKIKVTSMLRTQESIKRLQRGNVNSTSNSAHLYGTTFDISYVDFHESMFNTAKLNDGQLKNLLAEVLLELKDQEKCLVKFERKQGCFHITVKNPF